MSHFSRFSAALHLLPFFLQTVYPKFTSSTQPAADDLPASLTTNTTPSIATTTTTATTQYSTFPTTPIVITGCVLVAVIIVGIFCIVCWYKKRDREVRPSSVWYTETPVTTNTTALSWYMQARRHNHHVKDVYVGGGHSEHELKRLYSYI